ncbi:RNA polymerase sigma factor SigI [Rossellomorea marisflavi]|uniref:RNA polymerase sigma factor SigI n=1 Tax=Rossellomorea TaxID=2837508 RepID=UPI00064F352F|nr:RNA polymerase sigma factor SigI [Rossellomorea marisflavi]KMK96728.1 RNA polymerase sigma factor SigI [Rossellomorea marisflavi]KML06231.1 RNA polymerase sigma factor SigI [Rossellomorea marisflavi]KML32618.1 RNA polymerase sigma factor SigI [Rossellomorea marisflavi]MCM2603714.1 RNA polymerase sigma factor SigI [Rossellomorea marisflavi]QHA35935.1 RNA polymerase sigma factor SigI [Rossellomorea marisflavi]
MLNLLLLSLVKRKTTIEEKAVRIQKGEEELLSSLLDEYKPFIKKTVSSVCKRYITESDDEFSIGLIAFHDAIIKYNAEKGSSFISFAEVIIKRKVIDYIRKNGKYQDISVDMNNTDDEDLPSLHIEQLAAVDEYQREEDARRRREEIMQFTKQLEEYNLTFEDLIDASPKHEDARVNAINISRIVVEEMEFKDYLLAKRRLPIKKLEKTVSVSRKTIERNRKYIIAMCVILMGDYVYLRDYLKGRLGR